MKAAFPFIMAAVLGGCASQPQQPPITDTVGRYVFDYTMQGAKGARVVQVFDDGAKTYVQFNGLRQLAPLIRTGTGEDLPFERSGPYAVISGLHGRLLITVAGQTADVTNNRALPSQSSPGTDEAGVPPMERHSSQVQQLPAEVPKAPEEVARAHARESVPYGSKYVLRFADNSAAVHINADTLAELAELATHVRCLTITGYTDAAQVTAGGSRLAMRRALAVRKLLEDRGIDVAKVRVRFFGAGRFAADNTTAEGKASNRRVEIRVGEESAA